MNAAQRKKLQDALDIVTEVQEQEQEKYDNAPENLQGCEHIEQFQTNADGLQEAVDAIQSILDEAS